MIPSKSANVQQKGAENLKKNGPLQKGTFLNVASHLWVFWWKHPKMSVLGRGNNKNCPIFRTWHPHILAMWFFREKKPDAYWFVLAVWGYLSIPHIFKTLSESWAGSEDFGAFEIFHFLSRFASRSVEERWNVCRAGKGEKLRYSAGGRACW